MARLARMEVFAPDEVAIVHVMNRVVRRCFLLATDPTMRYAMPRRSKNEAAICINSYGSKLLRDTFRRSVTEPICRLA